MTGHRPEGARPPVEWVDDRPLTNTLRLPAQAGRLLILNDLSEPTLASAEVADWLSDPETRIIGGGSNVVFVTPRVARCAMIAAGHWEATPVGGDLIDLSVEAGKGLDELVRETTARGWFGLEALAEIPGTVGAAPMQNVGAYGTEIADRVRWVEVWDRHQRQRQRFSPEACEFAYRDSRFKREPRRWLILRVGLRLSTRTPAGWPPMSYPGVAAAIRQWSERTGQTATDISPPEYAERITEIRRAKLPDWRGGFPGSVGSFFHNPVVPRALADRLSERWPTMPRFDVADGVKIPAGWLIETTGLKGLRDGAVGVSPRHALVLEHHGGASGEAFMRFAAFVRDRVKAETGIELAIEPECVTQ